MSSTDTTPNPTQADNEDNCSRCLDHLSCDLALRCLHPVAGEIERTGR